MVVFVLVWLALSALAVLAFGFGSSVGYRRGFEDAEDSRGDQARDRTAVRLSVARTVCIPEDVHLGT